ncbi:hypothetical protein C8R48DRAFT_780134 [Suillus tomentosus]|nr:hypothetical protein C8R48DRAFT_780134 [Suillus tomentosus]
MAFRPIVAFNLVAYSVVHSYATTGLYPVVFSAEYLVPHASHRTGITFHQMFSNISLYLDDVPVNAFLLTTVIQILPGLVYFDSTAAFNALVDVAVIYARASNTMFVVISLKNAQQEILADSVP